LKKRPFLWYYLIALGIPITLMAAIIFFPYPLKLIHGGPVDLGEIFESAHEQTGLDGAETLIPSIRLCLAEPVLWLVNIWALSPTIAGLIMAALLFGRSGFKDLISRFKPGARRHLARRTEILRARHTAFDWSVPLLLRAKIPVGRRCKS